MSAEVNKKPAHEIVLDVFEQGFEDGEKAILEEDIKTILMIRGYLSAAGQIFCNMIIPSNAQKQVRERLEALLKKVDADNPFRNLVNELLEEVAEKEDTATEQPV